MKWIIDFISMCTLFSPPFNWMGCAHAIALSVNMCTLNCVHIEPVQVLCKAQHLHCPCLSLPFLCLFCGLLCTTQRLRQSSAHSLECIAMCRTRSKETFEARLNFLFRMIRYVRGKKKSQRCVAVDDNEPLPSSVSDGTRHPKILKVHYHRLQRRSWYATLTSAATH